MPIYGIPLYGVPLYGIALYGAPLYGRFLRAVLTEGFDPVQLYFIQKHEVYTRTR